MRHFARAAERGGSDRGKRRGQADRQLGADPLHRFAGLLHRPLRGLQALVGVANALFKSEAIEAQDIAQMA
ncbi:hypothetical protein [Sphingomonas baiyangensis]|uniref:hypothetical protein n=1 Tax=Sphingomonas baiyangensis TaxID=2572576 RepID=UPI001BB0B49B|nr:hypothetical protein [Sphingomonas baiyangensis]